MIFFLIQGVCITFKCKKYLSYNFFRSFLPYINKNYLSGFPGRNSIISFQFLMITISLIFITLCLLQKDNRGSKHNNKEILSNLLYITFSKYKSCQINETENFEMCLVVQSGHCFSSQNVCF